MDFLIKGATVVTALVIVVIGMTIIWRNVGRSDDVWRDPVGLST